MLGKTHHAAEDPGVRFSFKLEVAFVLGKRQMRAMAPGMAELTIFTCIFGGVVALTSVVYLVVVNRQYKKDKPKTDDPVRK